MPECYTILQMLIDNNRTDVELSYNTNFTKTSLKTKSVFDFWNQFSNVSIIASLDADGKRLEYLRQGSDFNEIVKNRREMMEKCPDVFFKIGAILSIFNALHLPDFHRSWVEQDLVKPENFTFDILSSPNYMSLKNAPNDFKIRVIEKFKNHVQWLRPLDSNGASTQQFISAINWLNENMDQSFNAAEFWRETKKLDDYFGVDVLTIFPELDILPKVN